MKISKRAHKKLDNIMIEKFIEDWFVNHEDEEVKKEEPKRTFIDMLVTFFTYNKGHLVVLIVSFVAGISVLLFDPGYWYLGVFCLTISLIILVGSYFSQKTKE